jgi:hypothetical protein
MTMRSTDDWLISSRSAISARRMPVASSRMISSTEQWTRGLWLLRGFVGITGPLI